jgi:hypothetical protein
LSSVFRDLLRSLFLKVEMKGLSTGVTTVYINEAVAVECEFRVTVELRYTPRSVKGHH